jgi:hypothetical protein
MVHGLLHLYSLPDSMEESPSMNFLFIGDFKTSRKGEMAEFTI